MGREQLYLDGSHTDQDLIVRHKARYFLLGGLCRRGDRVLDFPCGTGYGAQILDALNVRYLGLDRDEAALAYARRHYQPYGLFGTGDLTHPDLDDEAFDVIGCLEGLEHIDGEFQGPLIATFSKALKPGGVLLVSSPERNGPVSGPNPKNPYHRHELTRLDFLALLQTVFPPAAIELITRYDRLSDGEWHTCFYAVCHKEEASGADDRHHSSQTR